MFFPTLERIKSLADRYPGKTFTPKQFTHLLRMQFRDPRLRFTAGRDDIVVKKNFHIQGTYNPGDDEDGKPCITISLMFNPRCRRVSIKDYDWNEMSFHIADTVTHEYLHQYYCRRRGFEFGRGYRTAKLLRYSDTMKDYLGCEDEILAYAFNIASEMVVYDRHMVLTKVHRMYRRYFSRDRKVMLQLEKQVAKYIKRLEPGNEQSDLRSRTRYGRCV
jgi:hypothetical protein